MLRFVRVLFDIELKVKKKSNMKVAICQKWINIVIVVDLQIYDSVKSLNDLVKVV